ncbi:MAG: phage virion morphogenesis protein [Candidatus Accumulibacter sp.]|jgi:phage virion morphogenesis protein|nr:phage virion morphogenesis protein [Accumulibacter sp.]
MPDMVIIELDNRALIDVLTHLAAATGGGGLRTALTQIGEALAESTRQRFVSGVAPDGAPWLANAESTRARHPMGANKRPLIDTGELSDSIAWQIIGDDLIIGTNWGDFDEGAAVHQFGSLDGRIPARPFLGLSAGDEASVLDLIERHIAGAAGG